MKISILLRRLNFFRRKIVVLDALAKLLPLEQVEQIVQKTPDRRCIISTAAQWLGLVEQDFLKEVAITLRVGLLPSPSAVAPETFKSYKHIQDFKVAGAIPLAQDGVLSGIICVDPALCQELNENRLPLYLSTWAAVSEALELSEKAYLKKYPVYEPTASPEKSADELREHEQLKRTARKVITLMVNEADAQGACTLSISCNDEAISYLFQRSDSQSMSGTVNPSLCQALQESLEEYSLDSTVVPEGLERHFATFEQKSEREFQVRWQGQRPLVVALEKQNQVAGVQSEEGLPRKQSERVQSVQEEKALSETTLNKLPLEIVKEPGSPVEEVEVEEEVYSVLVVDDNATFSKVLERFFERQNLITDAAYNGEEGLALLNDGRVNPDLIVCDVHMPHMNGHEFLRKLRQIEKFEEIPVIMLTSDDEMETELKLLEGGADAFVAKSQDPRLLGVQVRRLLRMRARQEQRREAA